MILRQPTAEECEQIRVWRNAPDVLPILRTKEPITVEQQAAFYRDVICNPASEHRYYALEQDGVFIGIGGLTYIKDGKTEISLVLGPDYRGKGYGSKAVDALLNQAARPLMCHWRMLRRGQSGVLEGATPSNQRGEFWN